jgi:hypothetical protein
MRRTLIIASGWFAFLAVVYVVLGVRPLLPDSIGAGEICYRCKRVIADARLAAETMDGNLPTKYRTVGCMATYVAAHPYSGSRHYVTDYASGALIDADRAYFVSALINDTTGEHDYRAYLSRVSAQEVALVLGTDVIRWSAVIARART